MNLLPIPGNHEAGKHGPVRLTPAHVLLINYQQLACRPPVGKTGRKKKQNTVLHHRRVLCTGISKETSPVFFLSYLFIVTNEAPINNRFYVTVPAGIRPGQEFPVLDFTYCPISN